MTRCLDIVDAVSLIPYRGIFEHRMLKPAIILFPSFTKQILWVSCQLGPRGSTCWSGVRRITPGTNSGGWGRRRWSRSYGKPLDWDASLEPVEREGIKDDWVVQTPLQLWEKAMQFWPTRPEALLQSRTVGESVPTRDGEPAYHWGAQSWTGIACKVGGLCLELGQIFWTVEAGSGQLPALLHRVCPEGRS